MTCKEKRKKKLESSGIGCAGVAVSSLAGSCGDSGDKGTWENQDQDAVPRASQGGRGLG